jgi:RHS repeat-associated protein
MSRPDAASASSGLVDNRKSSGFGLAVRRDASHNVAVQNVSLNRVGTLTFRVAYDAYGEARHSWARDIDGDGDVDSDDYNIANAARTKEIHETGYNADADWNRDGEVTSTDVAAFGSTHHAGAIPAGLVAPRTSELTVGFCGYRFNPEIGAYTVRFRHYDPTPGMARWLERDPAGYVDGPSLYAYLGRSPVDGVDPSGLLRDDAMGGMGANKARSPAMELTLPPGSGNIALGAAGIAGAFASVVAAPVTVPAFLVATVVVIVSTDQLYTGIQEAQTGQPLDTQLHRELAGMVGEDAARVIEDGIAAVNLARSLSAIGKAGWKFLVKPYAPGKRPGGLPGSGLSHHSPVVGLERTGSALKVDPHHSFHEFIDNFAGDGSRFSIPTAGPGGTVSRYSDLYQLEGTNVDGAHGVFEWIVDRGVVTHRRFIAGGKVCGYPNQKPGKP